MTAAVTLHETTNEKSTIMAVVKQGGILKTDGALLGPWMLVEATDGTKTTTGYVCATNVTYMRDTYGVVKELNYKTPSEAVMIPGSTRDVVSFRCPPWPQNQAKIGGQK
jgi:hypothetical protein